MISLCAFDNAGFDLLEKHGQRTFARRAAIAAIAANIHHAVRCDIYYHQSDAQLVVDVANSRDGGEDETAHASLRIKQE
jgi:hypothetical protein